MSRHSDSACDACQVAMQQSATDPETGAIDMDIIQTGVSASRRRDREALANELAQLLLGGAPCPSHPFSPLSLLGECRLLACVLMCLAVLPMICVLRLLQFAWQGQAVQACLICSDILLNARCQATSCICQRTKQSSLAPRGGQSIHSGCTARGGGATVEELTALMAEQSSVNVTGKDVIEALSSIEGDIIREGQRIRHKHAAGR